MSDTKPLIDDDFAEELASLPEPSQVVTPPKRPLPTNTRRRVPTSPTDIYRTHLRTELTKAWKLAQRDYPDDVWDRVHKPWHDNLDELCDYAGGYPAGDQEYIFAKVDTSGPFAPGNVEWFTKDQLLLRGATRTTEFEGQTITLSELAKRTGISVATIRTRYEAGVRGPDLWNGRRIGARYVAEIAGKEYTAGQLAEMFGISVSTLRARIAKGVSGPALTSKEDRRKNNGYRPNKKEDSDD